MTDALTRRLSRPQRQWAARGGAVLALVCFAVYVVVDDLKPYVVTGISDGAIYALAAMGFIITFRTSGLFNFAIGAQAAASAYVFYSFRIDLGLPWPIAAAITLVAVGVFGSLLLERLAAWLSEAPIVLRVVAPIGLLVLLQSLLTGAYGVAALTFPQYLPTDSMRIAGVNVMANQIIITLLALAGAIGLYLFFRYTRLGVCMQAVVEDPNLLALQAMNPAKVRRYAWAIGSCFVSISGMLVAPAFGIDVNQLLLVYIAAFGAAAVGAFRNIAVAFVTAIGLGIAMNIMNAKLAGNSDIFIARLYTQLPFLALVLALLLIPRSRLVERTGRRVRRVKPVPTLPPRLAWSGGSLTVLAALSIPFVVSAADLAQYTFAVGFFVVFLSLGLLLWTSGQISLCQMSFAAVGAAAFAKAQHAGAPWLVALAFAALVAVPVGALVALPSFRLSGTYLAVITFGVGLLFQNLVYSSGLMFGSLNSTAVSRPDSPIGNTASDRGFYYVCVALAAACVAAVVVVRRSRLGRLLRALADSPRALDAHGTDTRLTRLFVFCVSAAIAAVGGALMVGVTGTASGQPSGPFGYFNSLIMVAVLAFCGRQPILSPLLAAVVFVVLKIYPPFDSPDFIAYQGVVFGAIAIGVAVLPGITGIQVRGRGTARLRGGYLHSRLDTVGRPQPRRRERAAT
jgi:branched-subunit amino acid ABC-type transport system permease component